MTYKRGSTTKRLCYPFNSLVSELNSGGQGISYNWSALSWNSDKQKWYGTNMEWGSGINDIPVTDQLTTGKFQDGSAEMTFYQVAPLIYTVQHDSLVFVNYTEGSSSIVNDRFSIYFRPVSKFPGSNIYRSLFFDWIQIGTFTELFSGTGDSRSGVQIPCKAGAQFAFFRDIINAGVNNTVQVKANVYNSANSSDTTERHITVIGNNSANNHGIKLRLYRDSGATTTGFIPVDFYIGKTQLADYSSNTLDFSPDNGCVWIYEIPMID